MKKTVRFVVGTVLIGLLAAAVVIGIWYFETTRETRYAALADKALQNGDAGQALAYAALADPQKAEEMRNFIAYREAEQALQSGSYEEAEAGFLALGAYRDAQSRVRECRYAQADALERAGDDAAAAEAFFALVPYADAEDRSRACRYRMAEQTLDSGDSHEAFRMFFELIPYVDTEVRATEIAIALTGESDPQKAIAQAKGLSEEEWQRILEITEAREALTVGHIAAGHAHAVFLFSDGHAEAVGDNAYGQCSVQAFTDICAVAAGYRHTVGLKSDRTVVAAGDNTYGQCAVEEWSDVVSITCGGWDTFAIRSDGTLLHCGFSEYDLTGWSNLRSVSACETALIGVRNDGTLLCTRQQGRLSGSTFCDAAIVTGSAFALDEEGTVYGEEIVPDSWKDVIALRNSASVLVGICADGSLVCRALIPVREAYLSGLRAEANVAEISPAGSYALILHRDGSVSAVGKVPTQVEEFLMHEPTL